MALSLGVKKGSLVKIGPSKVLEVIEVLPDNKVKITFGGATHLISDQERTLIEPDVYVSSGRQDSGQSGYRRLAIEAPRVIRIERVPS